MPLPFLHTSLTPTPPYPGTSAEVQIGGSVTLTSQTDVERRVTIRGADCTTSSVDCDAVEARGRATGDPLTLGGGSRVQSGPCP